MVMPPALLSIRGISKDLVIVLFWKASILMFDRAKQSPSLARQALAKQHCCAASTGWNALIMATCVSPMKLLAAPLMVVPPVKANWPGNAAILVLSFSASTFSRI